MTKTEFDKKIENMGPVLVGMFATGKVEAGERVSTDGPSKGKKEPFAMFSSVIIANRKAYTVRTNAKGDEEIQRLMKARGDAAKEDAIAPAKPGTPVYVEISSIKNDKGLQTISGKVYPFTV